MNILIVVAHHDDLEIGCGGTIAKLSDEGHNITSLVMTHSHTVNWEGKVVRSKEDAINEAQSASKILNYDLIALDNDTIDIEVNDENICKIKEIIQERKIEMIFTHFHGDTLPPHNGIYKMVIHASHHIPNVLGMQINWYIGDEPFIPRFFFPINESQWERKIQAIKCYKTEFNRIGKKWVEYFNNLTLNYGIQIGVKRAEAFVLYKFAWNI